MLWSREGWGFRGGGVDECVDGGVLMGVILT